MLFTAKRKSYPELFEFLAKELAPSVNKLIDQSGANASDCVMTWIPRKPAAVRKHGHDQAKMICLALAEEMGCQVAVPLLVRRGGAEQKRLDKKSRNKNTDESVFLCNKLMSTDLCKLNGITDASSVRELVEGKTVIVVDDIITTGASMRRAILLLEPQMPKSVLAVCVARSEIKSKK